MREYLHPLIESHERLLSAAKEALHILEGMTCTDSIVEELNRLTAAIEEAERE